jgi:hypothetical protein
MFFHKLQIVGLCMLAGAALGPLILGYCALQASGARRGSFPYAGWKSAVVLLALTAVVIIVGQAYGFWAAAAATVACGSLVGLLFGILIGFLH